MYDDTDEIGGPSQTVKAALVVCISSHLRDLIGDCEVLLI